LKIELTNVFTKKNILVLCIHLEIM